MVMSIGISSAKFWFNLTCQNPLSEYEKNKQTKHTVRYFICKQCRNLGHPKTKFTIVACIKCNAELVLRSKNPTLVCRECYKASRKYSAMMERRKERDKEKQLI